MRSKKIALVFISILISGLLCTPVLFSQTDEVLDNDGIIALINSGLPTSIILKKNESSPNRFDLSTDALIKLSSQKVPEEIINAMMGSEKRRVPLRTSRNHPGTGSVYL